MDEHGRVGAARGARLDPFVPTPHAAVVAACACAAVGAGDCVVDLGSGDGRWLIEAVRRGAVAVGYEHDAHLAAMARAVLPAGATCVCDDLRSADLQSATVVVAMLSEQHRPVVAALLARGAAHVRVVIEPDNCGGSVCRAL